MEHLLTNQCDIPYVYAQQLHNDEYPQVEAASESSRYLLYYTNNARALPGVVMLL